MKLDQFFSYLEAYYGEKYPAIARECVAEYLDGKSEEFLNAAYNALIKHVSRLYGRVPGIAELEKHLEEIQGEKLFGCALEPTVDVPGLYKRFGLTGTEAEKRRKLIELRDRGEASF
jgi:hypothetical protein